MLKDKLEGLKLSLVDEILIEDLCFSGSAVISTLGRKDGAVCAPILDFEVTGSDSLVIDRQSFNIQWSNVEIGKDMVSVVRNGKSSVYKIISNPGDAKAKRRLP